MHPFRELPRQSNDPTTPFLTTQRGVRRLRLLIDSPNLRDLDAARVLNKLCESEELDVWSTANDREQWYEIMTDQVVNEHFPIMGHHPGGIAFRSLPAATWRALAQRAESDLPTDVVLRQLCYAELAVECRFDLLITDSEFLLSKPFKLANRINIRSCHEGIAWLGLLLRSRGCFDVGEEGAFVRNDFWYYLIAARAALPASRRWQSACTASTGQAGPLDADAERATLSLLAQTTFERVNWAIRARDALLSCR
jgi:hypothetical protein